VRFRGWLSEGGWKTALWLAGAALAAFIAWGVHTGLAERDALRRDLAASEAQAETLRSTAVAADRAVTGNIGAKAQLHKRETAGLARTKAALEAHRDWAGQPIPDSVIDSLRD
jgi:hypothetical protein